MMCSVDYFWFGLNLFLLTREFSVISFVAVEEIIFDFSERRGYEDWSLQFFLVME